MGHAHGHHGHAHDGHGHHHHGHHHHGDATSAAGRKALRWSLILNGGFLLIEAAAGWWTGSLALLSDAGHMVGDVSALMLAYVVAGLATRPSTPSRTFGLTRAEALGAFVNGVALLVIVGFIVFEAIERMLGGPPAVPGWPVLVVGAIGLAINLGSAWALWRSASGDLNVQGALAHMLADALGSLGAMIAAGLILLFGWHWADAVVSLLVAGLVLWGAWRVVVSATRVLLDFAPADMDAERVEALLVEVDGVAAVHDIHIWGQAGARVMVTAHLVPTAEAAPFDVLKRAEASLRAELGVAHSTLQLEPRSGCPQPACPFAEPAAAHEHDEHDHHHDGHGHDHGGHDHDHGHEDDAHGRAAGVSLH